MLALKLLLVPVLIALVSLAGRRWGPSVAGWLAGLPLVGAPLMFFLAYEQGAHFAANAAIGALVGLTGFAAFCLAYAWAALYRPWSQALALAFVAFALAFAAGAQLPVLGLGAALALGAGSLVLGLAVSPRAEAGERRHPPRWELFARMAAAAAMVLVVTGLADLLGPRLSGLLVAFPTATSVLAATTHRSEGAPATVRLLRGLAVGMLSYCAFVATFALLVVSAGVDRALLAGVAAALTGHLLMLVAPRRLVPSWGRARRAENVIPDRGPGPAQSPSQVVS
jgi:hypothetical protein